MGCVSCSSGKSGLPGGCRNNGNCGASGCNKLEVFDWLSNMELPGDQKPFEYIEVRFKNGRKEFFRNSNNLDLYVGDVIVVEAASGYDVGIISITGELVRLQMQKKNASMNSRDNLSALRKANSTDIDKWKSARERENETMIQSRTIAIQLNLHMKISDVEYQGDGSKAVFYYTADGRVDFRELIKKLAEEFKIRIEMRQIGARQEAGRLGGIGSCGRELCCSTWLTDFRSVSTGAARYQQLSLNPQKLAGQCGKLKCCLNYELDSYLDALKDFPKSNVKLKTKSGSAMHFKTDIFKRIMWFMYEEKNSTKPVALSVDRVHEIMALNKDGKFPEDLSSFIEIIEKREVEYVDVLDNQDNLGRFDERTKSKKKRKSKKKSSFNNQPDAPVVKQNNTPRNENQGAKPRRKSNKRKGPRGGGNPEQKA